MRTPTPDVKLGFESPCATLPNCVCALGHALTVLALSPLVASTPPLEAPESPDGTLITDASLSTAPSAPRTPAARSAASSAGSDAE